MLEYSRTARMILPIVILLCLIPATLAAQSYKDSRLPANVRANDLLSRMTLEEKFWQLFMLAGSLDGGVQRYKDGAFGFQIGTFCDSSNAASCINNIQRHFVENTRLGIPIISFEEALHGLAQKGATSFPQAIGLAATFDTALMHEVSAAIARECRSSRDSPGVVSGREHRKRCTVGTNRGNVW